MSILSRLFCSHALMLSHGPLLLRPLFPSLKSCRRGESADGQCGGRCASKAASASRPCSCI
eukprot:3181337-Rhodomonas_salina.1